MEALKVQGEKIHKALQINYYTNNTCMHFIKLLKGVLILYKSDV